ncbi:hypothetical protein AC230_24745 [Streptomyces caatingaensis]|uniref:Uncharacterized protein n=2 Tax=Streptomyces caatingaensis TaxID=1678637 RepID=A0A0K9XAU5_9ACTN|nr:hypothetical protein AC230_24745 [Streptomyces caatingaensis]
MALLLGAALLGVYAWGLINVLGVKMDSADGGTDSTPPRPCRPGHRHEVENVTGYSITYLPLRVECQREEGPSYSIAVPEYVNPALLGLSVLTLGSATASLYLPRTRPEERYVPL